MSTSLNKEHRTDALAAIVRDAFIYAYPLVLMDLTRQQTTNVPDATTVPMRAPMNQFAHFRSYPKADSRDVVRFNFDTLYSFAWGGSQQGADGPHDAGHERPLLPRAFAGHVD